jgi:hypothetical protein
MKRVSPAGEQVDAAAAQLARARSRQDEAQAPCLDEAVHLVEQLGQALNLVEHHPSLMPRWNLIRETAGRGE